MTEEGLVMSAVFRSVAARACLVLALLLSLLPGSDAIEDQVLIIVGCSVGGVLVVVVFLICICLCCCRSSDYEKHPYYQHQYAPPFPAEKTSVPPGIWTTAPPMMHVGPHPQAPPPPPHGPPPGPKAPGMRPPPDHRAPPNGAHPGRPRYQQPPHRANMAGPGVYPHQRGVRKSHPIQRTMRRARAAIKRLPAVFQVRRPGGGGGQPHVKQPTQPPAYKAPQFKQEEVEKSVNISDTMKTQKTNHVVSEEIKTIPNPRVSATARIYSDYSNPSSLNGSQDELSQDYNYGAKIYSDYTDYSQAGYSTLDVAVTTARVYSNNVTTYPADAETPVTSQSTGNLPDGPGGGREVSRSHSMAAADVNSRQQGVNSGWTPTAVLANKTPPSSRRTPSELKKMPPAIRSQYMNPSHSFGLTGSEGSSLPSQARPYQRGVFLTRTPSDVAAQRLSSAGSQPKSNSRPKRQAPGVPSGAGVRRSQSDAAALKHIPAPNNPEELYAQPGIRDRQARNDPPPRLPPTPEDTVSHARRDGRDGRSRLEGETDVDSMPHKMTVQAVIEPTVPAMSSPKRLQSDSDGTVAAVADESPYTDFSVISGFQYTTKLFDFLDQYAADMPGADRDHNSVTYEEQGEDVMDAFKFLDEYGVPFSDESDVDTAERR